MKSYNVSGTIKKIDGFGWLSFLVKNAKYTGTMTLKGQKEAFDKYSGKISYTTTLGSVSGFWGISITDMVISKLGTKTVSGEPHQYSYAGISLNKCVYPCCLFL